jgi:hypothetical protein
VVDGPHTAGLEVTNVIGGIIVGFGIGLAAYGLGRLFLGASSRKRPSKLSHSAESIHPKSAFVEGAADEPPAEGARTEEIAGDAAPTSEVAPGLQLQADDETAEDESAAAVTDLDAPPGAKNWYLIRTVKGYLRACRCRAATPSTVAGPFATGTAANKAKQRYASLTPQSPRT